MLLRFRGSGFRESDSFGADENVEGGIAILEDWVWVWVLVFLLLLGFGGHRQSWAIGNNSPSLHPYLPPQGCYDETSER